MAQAYYTPIFVHTAEALIILLCLAENAYGLDPNELRYASLKRHSDSAVTTLALLHQFRGVASECSFLRDTARLFAHVFPGVSRPRAYPVPSPHSQAQELSGALEAHCSARTGLRRRDHDRGLDAIGGPPPTPNGAVRRSSSVAWALWRTSFSVYEVMLHLLCATNRMLLSFALMPTNVPETGLTEELLLEAKLGQRVARREAHIGGAGGFAFGVPRRGLRLFSCADLRRMDRSMMRTGSTMLQHDVSRGVTLALLRVLEHTKRV